MAPQHSSSPPTVLLATVMTATVMAVLLMVDTAPRHQREACASPRCGAPVRLRVALPMLVEPVTAASAERAGSTSTAWRDASQKPGASIERQPLDETRSLQAVRVTFAPGAAEPLSRDGYDVAIVPLDEGMSIELEGQAARWTPGVAFIISRG